MYLLTADTTAKTASVCIARDHPLFGVLPVAQFTQNGTLTHSESLRPLIDRALSLSSLALSDISALALPAGPGSFTGVRIGVSAFKGLSFALGKEVPCIPLSTLECLAENLSHCAENTILCPLMDARRNQFYNALFVVKGGVVKRLCPDRVITAKELSAELSKRYARRRVVLNGDGAELFFSLLSDEEKKPPHIALCAPRDLYEDAFSAAVVAARILRSGVDLSRFTGEALAPTYLRLSQAERERNEKLKRETL